MPSKRMLAGIKKRPRVLSEAWKFRRPETVEKYIKLKTKKSGACLLWIGAKENRVGSFNYDGESGGAPRKVYEALVGPIPNGLCILHSCDDPRCVNIKHLRVGDKKENRADFMKRHPHAKELLLAAARSGARGVKKFWENMTSEERASFTKRRARIQKSKSKGWSAERIANHKIAMAKRWSEEARREQSERMKSKAFSYFSAYWDSLPKSKATKKRKEAAAKMWAGISPEDRTRRARDRANQRWGNSI